MGAGTSARSRLWRAVLGSIAAAIPMTLLIPSAWAGTQAVHWTQVSPLTSPAPRYGATEAYDKLHQVVVLFGGFDGGQPRNDTWVWNGTNWKLMHPTTSPPARI